MGVELGLLLNKMTEGILKKSIDKTFYRNGQLREVVPLRNGRRHGVVRVWHKNGVLETEDPRRVQQLQHDVQHAWMRFFRFIKQERAFRCALAHSAQITNFAKTRAEQQAERFLILKLRHIEA